MLQAMRMTKGGTKWQQPPGWDFQGLTKAGREPNPWYGLFPVAWRSQGNHPRSVEAKIIREREITALSKVGKVAIQGCETIWATATKVWATRMNNLRFASRPRPAPQTRRQIRRRVALTLQEEDEEAVRKSLLDRFNLERANSLARQTRKAARGTKRRWSLQESEAQR